MYTQHDGHQCSCCNWKLLCHGQEHLAHENSRQEVLEPSVENSGAFHVDPCPTGHEALQSDATACCILLAPGQAGPFVTQSR